LNKNLVVLAGDTHNAWANDLKDLDGNAVGVEFAGPGVTSPGLEELLGLVPPQYAPVEAGFELLIDDLRYLNVADRGYLTVTFTAETATCNWQFVDNILSEEYAVLEERARTLQVFAGSNQISS
jgi:alkaline phosphatase D